MLQLKNIKKDYSAGETAVHALKGIDLQFRESEFVSILGPSGCGKTTMLNIIGGLDQYTEGDLIINGKSTKDFKDRDWDTYRNHSIGFVFQSYNLIPHQTTLQNVELALTLSGVSKSERKTRAKKALEEVGLGNQLHKKPSEMSGGQMQRVAIARALVNNPDIILADEPTGALDTETSLQVMEILKEVAKERLVIMVTHNPELAEKYSTRIIRMLDGSIINDSKPLTTDEIDRCIKDEQEKNLNKGKIKKPSMSLFTSFGLSLKNLFSKKGRTILTSFAGSIGIIGIALIFAVSQGTTTYINMMQEDTLASYPLSIEATNVDITTLMQTFMGASNAENEHENDAIYTKAVLYKMIDSMNNLETTKNDLKSFKQYIEKERTDENSRLFKALSGIKYTYDLNLLVYTKNVDGTIIHSDTQEMLTKVLYENLGIDMSPMMSMREQSTSIVGMSSSSMSSMFSGPGASSQLWEEMLSGDNGKLISQVLENQYDIVYGSWPNSYDEIVLVLDENNELDDLTLYALGLESKDEIEEIFDAVKDKTALEKSDKKWSYEDVCNTEFHVILNSDCYALDEKTGLYTDLRETDAGLRYLYDNGMKLKVAGIVKPSENATSSMLKGSIGYTSKLTEYVIEHSKESEAIKQQLADTGTDIFTGLPFQESTGKLTDSEKENEFRSYIASLDETGKAKAYIKIMGTPTAEQLNTTVSQYMGSMTRTDMEKTMVQTMSQQMSMSEEDILEYAQSMSDDELKSLFTEMITEQVKAQTATQAEAQLKNISSKQLAMMLDNAIKTYTTEQCALYYDEVLTFSKSTYEDNLIKLGCVDLDNPASVNLFSATFEDKDVVEDSITSYNNTVDELSQIHYTDYVGLIMSSVTSIINAITYVLIAFVAISLVVSSIMIGVITLISVQERTKEIGILRAIGASKRDVSSMFNAETIIIGFTSGLLGILVTYVLCIPINMIIHNLTGIRNLNAYLPTNVAVVLVIISVLLTMIAGIIPSRSAAKKDPVIALRTE